jgi:hypothetical protein
MNEVLKLAKLGWHLVVMQHKSKNPGSLLGSGWQEKATNNPDVINAWLEVHEKANIGLLLGPKSGVIDLEYDDDEGREIIEKACVGITTVAYKSAKSVHRLFAWDDRMEHEKTKVGIRGTEWRFGQDSAQSVIPPSEHNETDVIYEWLPGQSPDDVPVARLPDSLWELFEQLKAEHEEKTAKENPVKIPRSGKDHLEDSIIDQGREFCEAMNWEDLLTSAGWTFCRNRSSAQDWWRPGKTRGSISGTVNYGGTNTLRVFSTSCDPLEADSSYDKFAFICRTQFKDDPIETAKTLLPQDVIDDIDKRWRESQNCPEVDLSMLLGNDRTPDFDDEEFISQMIPETGLLRDVYDFYSEIAHRKSEVMGLSVAVSFCEVLFGRRIASHTDLRTNDYNVIIAPTNCGKEACEKTITKIFTAIPNGIQFLAPPDIQSGNGLLRAVASSKCLIWIADEFGKVLASVLDKRQKMPHLQQIATHLLKLYGKADALYGGASHSDGMRHQVLQPHLVTLGLTTGSTLFESVDSANVSDGLFGRIAFWPVQSRPERRRMRKSDPSDELLEKVSAWAEWKPSGNLGSEFPNPSIVNMTPDALHRWEAHSNAIDEKMDSEKESRAAIWGRVAARSMKLALVHRASRETADPATINWELVFIEMEDIQWGISIANWLGRIACDLVSQNFLDHSAIKNKAMVVSALNELGEVSSRKLLRSKRSMTAGELKAIANELEKEGFLTVEKRTNGGRPSIMLVKK